LGRIYLGIEDSRKPNSKKGLSLIKWSSENGYVDAKKFIEKNKKNVLSGHGPHEVRVSLSQRSA
jgi:hypothetical protein